VTRRVQGDLLLGVAASRGHAEAVDLRRCSQRARTRRGVAGSGRLARSAFHRSGTVGWYGGAAKDINETTVADDPWMVERTRPAGEAKRETLKDARLVRAYM